MSPELSPAAFSFVRPHESTSDAPDHVSALTETWFSAPAATYRHQSVALDRYLKDQVLACEDFMIGYQSNFLGIELPLPSFSPALVGEVLQRDTLEKDHDGVMALAHYPHYSIAMHREERTALYAALNIDQALLRTAGSRSWRIDTRIGGEFQLNNDYYKGATNLYDRGHLARRASAAWGKTASEAQRASEETYYYSNASLQHRYFNEDEWLEVENWVKDLGLDSTNRISVFSGPIFGDLSRTIKPAGRSRAVVPSAYFKVVAFIVEGGALAVRSFIVVQDREAIADRDGDLAIEREDAEA
ncbi:MAG: DNA/RNA non-specific endonuclease, partial [Pseudomonadota bacterium]